MAKQPDKKARFSKHGNIVFSPHMWERIDRGEVDEKKAYDTMRQAFGMLDGATLAGLITIGLEEVGKGNMPAAQQRGLEGLVEQFEMLAARSGGAFDPLALEATRGTEARSLLKIALNLKGEKGQLGDASLVPLISFLSKQGASIDQMLINARGDQPPPGVGGRTLRYEKPEGILKQNWGPAEYHFLLNQDIAVDEGALCYPLTVVFANERPNQIDVIKTGVENGLSILQKCWSQNSAPELINIIIQQERRNLSGAFADSAKKTIAQYEQINAYLTERMECADAFMKSFQATPSATALTREKMLLLANIDMLPSALMAHHWDQEDAASLLQTVRTLPLFVQRQLTIETQTLVDLAGEKALSVEEYHGTLQHSPNSGRNSGERA